MHPRSQSGWPHLRLSHPRSRPIPTSVRRARVQVYAQPCSKPSPPVSRAGPRSAQPRPRSGARVNSENNSSRSALEALHGTTWRVLHDLVIGSRGANVDHLVIGPGGVFTINTKNVSGSVWVAERALLIGGTKHSEFLPKAVNEAAHVSSRLSRAVGAHVDVSPAIVFVDSELTVKANVHTCRREQFASASTSADTSSPTVRRPPRRSPRRLAHGFPIGSPESPSHHRIAQAASYASSTSGCTSAPGGDASRSTGRGSRRRTNRRRCRRS